ncbi:PaaI family thioesterase [bacterium]|nr:PaaI family thioesterase [bacterium]
MKEIPRYSGCFVCGDQNEHGLQAIFTFDGERALCTVEAREMFEGYRNIYHGGIISTVLDEVMIKAILAREIYAVTAEMTVKFLQPVPIGETLTFTGRVTNSKGRLYLTEGEARGAGGTIYATATGKYVRAKEELKAKLLDSLD